MVCTLRVAAGTIITSASLSSIRSSFSPKYQSSGYSQRRPDRARRTRCARKSAFGTTHRCPHAGRLPQTLRHRVATSSAARPGLRQRQMRAITVTSQCKTRTSGKSSLVGPAWQGGRKTRLQLRRAITMQRARTQVKRRCPLSQDQHQTVEHIIRKMPKCMKMTQKTVMKRTMNALFTGHLPGMEP